MQRVKDVERFQRDLERPLPGETRTRAVTPADLDRDAESFMAFASAFGIKPPTRVAGSPNGAEAVVPSAPAS